MHSCTVQKGDQLRGEMTAQGSPARFSNPGRLPPRIPGRDRDGRPQGPGHTPGQHPEVSTRQSGQACARVSSPPPPALWRPGAGSARPARPGPSLAVTVAVWVDSLEVGFCLLECQFVPRHIHTLARARAHTSANPTGRAVPAGRAALQAGTPQTGSDRRLPFSLVFLFVLSLYNH